MDIQRDQGTGKHTHVSYDRINPTNEKYRMGLCAYSEANWKKVSLFTRFACLILGNVTEVEIGKERFYIPKKSFQEFTGKKDVSDEAIYNYLSKVSRGEIHKPVTKAGILALGEVKTVLSNKGVEEQAQERIVKKLQEPVEGPHVVIDETPKITVEELKEESKHIEDDESEVTADAGSIVDEEESFSDVTSIEETVSEEQQVKIPSLVRREQIRQLINTFNALQGESCDAAKEKLYSLNEELEDEALVLAIPIRADQKLADEIIRFAATYGENYQFADGKLELDLKEAIKELAFEEKEVLRRLQHLMPSEKAERAFSEIMTRNDRLAALELLQKILQPSYKLSAQDSARAFDESMRKWKVYFTRQREPLKISFEDFTHLMLRFDVLAKLARPADEKLEVTELLPPLVDAEKSGLSLASRYSTGHEAREALQSVFSLLGPRAAGTMTLSERDDVPRLHILATDGQPETYFFTLTERAGKEYLVRETKEYESIDHFLRMLQEEDIKKQLSKLPVGSFFVTSIAGQEMLYVTSQANVVTSYPMQTQIMNKKVTIGNNTYSTPLHFVKTLSQAAKEVQIVPRQFFSADDVSKQIKLKDVLQNQFFCVCSETEQIPLLKGCEGFSPSPFFLRAVKAGEKGDFTCVTPTEQHNIEILPGGKIKKIKYTDKGEEVRLYDTVAQWGNEHQLGEFIYDHVIAEHSSCSTIAEAVEALRVAPMNCYLLWKDQERIFVSVRMSTSSPPQTFELHRRDGSFVLRDEAQGEMVVQGELTEFLDRQFKLPSYKAAYALMQSLGACLETGETDLARFQAYADEGALFTLSREKRGYSLTTFTPRIWGLRSILSPVVEKFSLHFAGNGSVVMMNRQTRAKRLFVSMDDFKEYLYEMIPLKFLELDKSRHEANIRAVIGDAKKAGSFVKSEKEAGDAVNIMWSYLGTATTDHGLIYQEEAKDHFTMIYKDRGGMSRRTCFYVESDGLHVVGRKDLGVMKNLGQLLYALDLHPLAEPVSKEFAPVYQLFKNIEASRGYVPGGKLGVEQAFTQYKDVMAHRPIYALSVDQNAQGLKQIFVSYFDDTGKIVHDLVDEELGSSLLGIEDPEEVEARILEEYEGISQPFPLKREKIEKIQKQFTASCDRIKNDPNFDDRSWSDIKRTFERVKQSRGAEAVDGFWVILPAKPTASLWALSFPEPDVTNCRIFLVKDGKEQVFELQIDPNTGKFLLHGELYNTLDTGLEALGVDLAKSYSSLVNKI